ncbi:MAG: pimeloyl-ACP methyl ester carboxylesterase [Polyangiales bacterium]|jgi:pimeloyl-ACP methyl ester carboxylesterase
MKAPGKRTRRAILFLVLAGVAGVAVLYMTRLSWGPGMIITAPSSAYAAVSLPSGVERAIEIERDAAIVRGWLVEPASPPRGTLVMLHGIRSSKASLLPAARGHATQGFRVLVVDSRGHGESSGPFLTYGVKEAQDLLALTSALEAEGLLSPPLIVLGTSYGAATAIQYAALDERVDFTIAVAPFASLQDVVPAYIEWILGPFAGLVPAHIVVEILDECQRLADFDPTDASPLNAAARIRRPVRILHSQDDERIPIAHARDIAAALEDGELVEIAGASHTETGGGPEVEATIDGWLEEAVSAAR